MAIANHIKPYTLTDLKVAALAADGTPGTLIDVPGIRSLGITVANDAIELRGDNSVIAIADQGNSGEFTMEAGGLSEAALVVIFGGTSTTTGVTPNGVKTYSLKETDGRPYFAIVGVQPDDGAGEDIHYYIPKAKATGNFEITATDQEFTTPSFSGRFIGRASDGVLYQQIHHETATAAAVPV